MGGRDDNDRLREGALGTDPFEDAERTGNNGQARPEQGWRADARDLCDVKPRRVRWFWPPRVAVGMVNILCGAKSSGKSGIACRVVAAASTGGLLPADGAEVQVPQGRTIYLGAEDPPAETLVPRLVAAGTNLRNVRHMDYVRNPEGVPHVLTLARDWARLVAEAERMRHETLEGALPLVLLVVDTLYTHCGADINSSEEMAPVMGRLSWFAAEFESAVLVVHHPVKMPHARASSDIAGATNIGTAARIQLLAGTNEDKSRRALFHLDSNIGPEARPIGYQVAPAVVEIDGERYETSRVDFTGQTDLTLDEIRNHRPQRQEGAPERAEAWLRNELENGPRPTEEIQAAARSAGISEDAEKKARKALGCTPKRVGSAWWLALPQHVDQLGAMKPGAKRRTKTP